MINHISFSVLLFCCKCKNLNKKKEQKIYFKRTKNTLKRKTKTITTKNTLKKKRKKTKIAFLLTKKGYKDYNKKDNVMKQFKQKKEQKNSFCIFLFKNVLKKKITVSLFCLSTVFFLKSVFFFLFFLRMCFF